MYKVLGSDQQVYGPVTAAQIRQWMAEGRVNQGTLLQPEGATEWRPLSSFPEFAVPPPLSMPPPAKPADANSLALWALICGILSNICCCFGTLFAVLGLIFSIIVLTRRQDYPSENTRMLAWAGLVLCVIGLILRCLAPWVFFMPRAWRWRRGWIW